MTQIQPTSDFLNFLVASQALDNANPGELGQIPPLQELSKELGVSVASLREQVEVAEAFGMVEVRPRTGIRPLPYSFFPAVHQSLAYAIRLNQSYFEAFSELRNQVEAAFWDAAVRLLKPEDHQALEKLVDRAWAKLHGNPIQIPHLEHRQLHLLIFSRLDNPFVLGILRAYWEAYENVGLNVYADYNYLREVWTYHQQMVDSIRLGNYDAGLIALIKHKDLIHQRPHTDGSPLPGRPG